jgi:hypothetical protein
MKNARIVLALLASLVGCRDNPDFMSTAGDLGTTQSASLDFAPVNDTATTSDAAMSPDSATLVDAAMPSDSALPVDMASPPDLTTSHACDGQHADCNQDTSDGCETAIYTALNCGGCGITCVPQGGTNSCVASGSSYACKPTCDNAHVDCDGNPNNGCEVALASDPGESDNACPGEQFMVSEGTTQTFSTHRILPAGDVDMYAAQMVEAVHVCEPPAAQPYVAIVTLTAPSGVDLQLTGGTSSCGAPGAKGSQICIQWQGTCGVTDQPISYFAVEGTGSSVQSCADYSVSVHYCKLGSSCENCL